MNRRQFLIRSSQTVLGGIAISALPSWANALAQSSEVVSVSDFSPIAQVSGSFASQVFNGDRVDRPHDILWDIEGFLRKNGGEPAVSADYDVIVVGGGIAGLTAAYELRNKKVLLLDQDTRLGGNSKGETYRNTTYSIGAAYICEPSEDSDTRRVLTELGLIDKLRGEHGNEVSVFHKGKLTSEFWAGKSDPSAKDQFAKINAELTRIYESEYPEIPLSQESRNYTLSLDKMSFAQWLTSKFGKVHSDVEEYFRLYAWSSFGGSIDHLSAAQMINFVAAETGTVMALPGGNSRIAARLTEALSQSGVELEAGALAIKVKVNDDQSAQVCFLDGKDKLVSARAKAIVFAAPKFVASKIIADLPAQQVAAMNRVSYRSYVVANALLKTDIQSPGFDLYNLRGSQVIEPGPLSPGDRFVSDVCFGDWANSDNGESVLTLYMPLPYDGARQFLFKESSHESFKQKATQELKAILSALGLTEESIEGIRLTRWGHSLPVAKIGFMAEGLAEQASVPVKHRIYFANQDNWANPSFETAFSTALEAAEAVRKLI